MVCLNRRYNARAPTGIYCCDMPGSNGNWCVGAYNLRDGKLSFLRQNGHQIMNITDIGINFSFDGSLLTCSTNTCQALLLIALRYWISMDKEFLVLL